MQKEMQRDNQILDEDLYVDDENYDSKQPSISKSKLTLEEKV